MTPVVAVETNDDKQESIKNPSVRDQGIFNSLTPEQQIRVVQAKQTMAEKFEKLGAKAEDFSVILRRVWDTEERTWVMDGSLVVAYAAPKGIDLAYAPASHDEADMRSWGSIFEDSDENDSRFIVQVQDEELDTREGMTGAVYVDLFEQYQASRGEDESPFDGESFTYLTGDPIKDHWITKADWRLSEVFRNGQQEAVLYPHTANRETITVTPGEWNIPDFIDSQGIPVGHTYRGRGSVSVGSLDMENYFTECPPDPYSFRPAIIID